MVKNWEQYKNEIEDLYMHQDKTLEAVMNTIHRRHGFKASERAYKMKLDEWSMKKYRSRQRKLGTRSSSPGSSSTSSQPRGETTLLTLLPKPLLEPAPTVSTPTIQSLYTSDSSPLISNSKCTCNHTSQSRTQFLTTPTLSQQQPLLETSVINSSLKFYSSHPPTHSLYHLTNTPSLTPLALEILLRNWNPHSTFLPTFHSYLDSSAEACQDIMSVNHTRWTDTDESLFDLVVELECVEEREELLRGLLRADYRCRGDGEGSRRSVEWKKGWRRACEVRDWRAVESLLMGLEVSGAVRRAALDVLAEQFSRRN